MAADRLAHKLPSILQKPVCLDLSVMDPLPADAIVGIIFGSLNVVLMLAALWQVHRYVGGKPGKIRTLDYSKGLS